MRFAAAWVLALAITCGVGTTGAQTLYSCPDDGFGADNISRGFYVSSYPGYTLNTVTLAYVGFPAGTYQVTLTPRLGTYNGATVGTPQTLTVTVSATATTPFTFNFSNAPVPLGSTVTFTQTLVSGPGALDFDTGTGPCTNITETVATTPPLDVFRRDSVGLVITGSLTPIAAVNIPALSPWTMLLLVLVLGASAAVRIRRS